MVYANCLPIGVTISFLHDIADVSVSLPKFFGLTRASKTAAVTMIVNMFVWGYTRMVVLPYMIYNIFLFTQSKATTSQENFQTGFDMFKSVAGMSGIMLCAMCFLHFYWFSIFVQMVYIAITTGKSEDIQNKVTNSKHAHGIKKTN